MGNLKFSRCSLVDLQKDDKKCHKALFDSMENYAAYEFLKEPSRRLCHCHLRTASIPFALAKVLCRNLKPSPCNSCLNAAIYASSCKSINTMYSRRVYLKTTYYENNKNILYQIERQLRHDAIFFSSTNQKNN